MESVALVVLAVVAAVKPSTRQSAEMLHLPHLNRSISQITTNRLGKASGEETESQFRMAKTNLPMKKKTSSTYPSSRKK